MTQIKAKVAAMGALQGLRQDWGCQRAWARDYLSSVSIGQVRGIGCSELTLQWVFPAILSTLGLPGLLNPLLGPALKVHA